MVPGALVGRGSGLGKTTGHLLHRRASPEQKKKKAPETETLEGQAKKQNSKL